MNPSFVEFMPETLEDGILYISDRFRTAIHNCACGCGVETVTPLRGEKDWTLTRIGGLVSLHPSIGNQKLPCKSHYWIINNKVVWV